MNRRSFISTLTALLGVVLAKFKAPVAPKHVADIKFKNNGKILAQFKNGRMYTLDAYGQLLDTCPYCLAQAIPGYELICCCQHSPTCTCSTCS